MKKREAVSHIMSKEVHTVHRKQSLQDVEELIEKYFIRHVPVVEGEKVVGILSRTDLMRIRYGALKGQEEMQKSLFQQMLVEEAMTPLPTTVTPETSIREVGEMLHEAEFSALPVVENNKLVGIVTTTDLIGYLLEMY